MVYLALLHVFILTVTNVSVQFPFTFMGFHSTYGVFTYPLIFIITDLTVRFFGPKTAQRTVFFAMIPGLLISYWLASFFTQTQPPFYWFMWNELAFRVALASFSAYLLGQLLDILVFQRLRRHRTWWLAPTSSSVVGNVFDTFLFFFIAFYQCRDPFFANHWPEIALVDLGFKLFISLLSMIPLYGALLKLIEPKPAQAYLH